MVEGCSSCCSALLIIDMQMGFLDPASGLCVAGGAAVIPACARLLESARKQGIPVIHVRRRYAADGSDVEPSRVAGWAAAGRPISDVWPQSLEAPSGLAEMPGERIVWKPTWSSFCGTKLEELLRGEGVSTVVVCGVQTPNCIRATCYDALSLGFNVAVVADATASRDDAAQAANLMDMSLAGVDVIGVSDFEARGAGCVTDRVAQARDILDGIEG